MRVTLVRSWPHRHEGCEVELPDGACVADALQQAGWALTGEFVGLAVFGAVATEATLLHAGDRIELLRGLQCDPKQARRRRADGFVRRR